MSAEASGWVFRHATYNGMDLVVLLAVADSVNDQNNNEFWMTQGSLAAKARTTERTVRRVLDRLLADGWLQETSGHSVGRGRCVRHFIFAFPDLPVAYETRRRPDAVPAKPDERSYLQTGRERPLNRTRATAKPDERSDRTQEEPKEDPNIQTRAFDIDTGSLESTRGRGQDYRFQDAWEAYPYRGTRRLERKKALEQWRKLTYTEKSQAFKAIPIYAGECNGYPKDMFRWLRDRLWEDCLSPPLNGHVNGGHSNEPRERATPQSEWNIGKWCPGCGAYRPEGHVHQMAGTA